MTERINSAPEGWSVRHRPAVVAALLFPLVLAGLLIVAGWFYDRHLRPSTRQPVAPFPAPGLETFIHEGAQDPHRPRAQPHAEARLAAAKRAVLRDGIAGWERKP